MTSLGPDGDVARQTRRFARVKLAGWAGGMALAGYLVLYAPFVDRDGNEYEHVFSPLRRAWMRNVEQGLLGLPPRSAATASQGTAPSLAEE